MTCSLRLAFSASAAGIADDRDAGGLNGESGSVAGLGRRGERGECGDGEDGPRKRGDRHDSPWGGGRLSEGEV